MQELRDEIVIRYLAYVVFGKGQSAVGAHQLERYILAEGNQDRFHAKEDKIGY